MTTETESRKAFTFVDVTPPNRPLKKWPTELLVWLFWSNEIDKLDPSDMAVEMIHAEMNHRGEGHRVAV